jgi:hypothetical protein
MDQEVTGLGFVSTYSFGFLLRILQSSQRDSHTRHHSTATQAHHHTHDSPTCASSHGMHSSLPHSAAAGLNIHAPIIIDITSFSNMFINH